MRPHKTADKYNIRSLLECSPLFAYVYMYLWVPKKTLEMPAANNRPACLNSLAFPSVYNADEFGKLCLFTRRQSYT